MSEPEDPLEALRTQIRAATDTAEQLLREARAASVESHPGTDPRRRPNPQPGAPRAPGPQPTRAPAPTDAQRLPDAASGTPPAGWAASEAGRAADEIDALAQLLRSLRNSLPDDMRQQLAELVRQLLILLRTVIDWALSRIEHEGRGREVEPEDIPIV